MVKRRRRRLTMRSRASQESMRRARAETVFCAAFRLAAPDAIECGDEEAGNGADEIGRAPTPQAAQFPAGEIAEGGADGDGEIKDRQDAVAVAIGVEIGEHGWRVDAEGGLAHADQGAAGVEAPVGVNEGGAERGKAPDDGAGDDERLAAIPVAQPAASGATIM